jgi:DNA polymerase I
VVFKEAGNRLDKLYRQYNARIIIPVHDAFIFEAPLEEMKTVAELTSRVMCEMLQEYFPVLRPRVEVNIDRPDCWNKDGDGDELERWISSLNELMHGQEIGDKEV